MTDDRTWIRLSCRGSLESDALQGTRSHPDHGRACLVFGNKVVEIAQHRTKPTAQERLKTTTGVNTTENPCISWHGYFSPRCAQNSIEEDFIDLYEYCARR